MPYSVVRRVEFDCAHRLINHAGKCKNIHGHRYAVEVEFTRDVLDDNGMVVDFGIMKNLVDAVITDQCDHALLLSEFDTVLRSALIGFTRVRIFPFETTAENLAKYWYDQIKATYPSVSRVTVFETPNCSATYGDDTDDA